MPGIILQKAGIICERKVHFCGLHAKTRSVSSSVLSVSHCGLGVPGARNTHEAHLLEKETIEEFRFLLNYRFDSISPMALVLVGQTELWDKLRMQRYAAVRQRIDINCVLPHLDRSETERYIQSHLAYAGGRQDIFTDKALDDIYKESTGIPRRINRICEKSLMYASQQGKRLIDEHLVRYIIEHEMLGGDTRQ